MITCLSERMRKLMRKELEHASVADKLTKELENIPGCRDGAPIGFEKERTRQPSAYQQFISQCMKAKNLKGFGESSQAMKECASRWRSEKEKRA